MAQIVKITKKYQITLPKQIRERIHGLEQGSRVQIEAREDELVIRPIIEVPQSQGWFWTPEWQQAEREVEESITAGNLSPTFTSAKEGISYLHLRRKEIIAQEKKERQSK